ncbi:hypothetical protein QBC39DRAFT_372104 [Podospora conica]|nr:hypothetical protein QBC39DRAFT_372104 [Schizothecium conicum]
MPAKSQLAKDAEELALRTSVMEKSMADRKSATSDADTESNGTIETETTLQELIAKTDSLKQRIKEMEVQLSQANKDKAEADKKRVESDKKRVESDKKRFEAEKKQTEAEKLAKEVEEGIDALEKVMDTFDPPKAMHNRACHTAAA